MAEMMVIEAGLLFEQKPGMDKKAGSPKSKSILPKAEKTDKYWRYQEACMFYRLSVKLLPEGAPLFTEVHYTIFNEFMMRFGSGTGGLSQKVWRQHGGGIVLWGGDGRHWYRVLPPGVAYVPEEHPGYRFSG